MARTAWPTVLSGDSWTASQHNTYGRDNDLAYWVYTTAGDMAYATSASALARLAIGGSYQILGSNGSIPVWTNRLTKTILYKSSTQSFNSGTPGDITWDAETIDDGSWHSTVSNTERITITSTGYYVPFVSIRFRKNTGGSGTFIMTAVVNKNGSETPNFANPLVEVDANAKRFTFGGVPVSANASDYFTVNFTQNSGGAGTIDGGGPTESTFTLIRLR